MPYSAFILNGGNNNDPRIVGFNNETKRLIEEYKRRLKERQEKIKHRSKYGSIKEILVLKYHIENVDNLELPDLSTKEEFNVEGVRGNVQKINGNILTYAEGQKIIDDATKIEIP